MKKLLILLVMLTSCSNITEKARTDLVGTSVPSFLSCAGLPEKSIKVNERT